MSEKNKEAFGVGIISAILVLLLGAIFYYLKIVSSYDVILGLSVGVFTGNYIYYRFFK